MFSVFSFFYSFDKYKKIFVPKSIRKYGIQYLSHYYFLKHTPLKILKHVNIFFRHTFYDLNIETKY